MVNVIIDLTMKSMKGMKKREFGVLDLGLFVQKQKSGVRSQESEVGSQKSGDRFSGFNLPLLMPLGLFVQRCR
jgi:hypothetical protein